MALSKKDFIEPVFLPLGQIVSFNAERIPEVVALTQTDRETTWAEFERYSNQVANGLIAEGIGEGARIAYLGKTTDDAFQIMHGVAKAGAVFTPINWRLAAPEVVYILEDAEAEFLFVSIDFLPLVEDALGDYGSPKKLVVLDDDDADGHQLAYRRWRDAFGADHPGIEIRSDDVVLQLYTSGTTGHPKGALITHEYTMNAVRMLHALEEDIYDMLPGEEYLNCFPIFHGSGAIWGQCPAFARGCGIVIFPDFDPEKIFECIGQRAIPILGSVPTMLHEFLLNPKFTETDFSNLRYIAYGAAPMPVPLRDRLVELVDCRFAQGYGATESLMISLLSPKDHETESERLLSVGQAMPGVEIKIVDSEGRKLPVGEIGEVAIRSPVIAKGYWNLPEATSAAFRDGWYLTGDGGYLDEGGYLFLKERIKDLIISGGENIYPAEIENLLYAHPMVESAAVVALPDEKWGEVPLAFILVKEGASFDADVLRAYVNEKLARYKQPKYYSRIDAMPLNASGKVLKKDLRDLAKALHCQRS